MLFWDQRRKEESKMGGWMAEGPELRQSGYLNIEFQMFEFIVRLNLTLNFHSYAFSLQIMCSWKDSFLFKFRWQSHMFWDFNATFQGTWLKLLCKRHYRQWCIPPFPSRMHCMVWDDRNYTIVWMCWRFHLQGKILSAEVERVAILSIIQVNSSIGILKSFRILLLKLGWFTN